MRMHRLSLHLIHFMTCMQWSPLSITEAATAEFNQVCGWKFTNINVLYPGRHCGPPNLQMVFIKKIMEYKWVKQDYSQICKLKGGIMMYTWLYLHASCSLCLMLLSAINLPFFDPQVTVYSTCNATILVNIFVKQSNKTSLTFKSLSLLQFDFSGYLWALIHLICVGTSLNAERRIDNWWWESDDQNQNIYLPWYISDKLLPKNYRFKKK